MRWLVSSAYGVLIWFLFLFVSIGIVPVLTNYFAAATVESNEGKAG
jgi:hypothetical protein